MGHCFTWAMVRLWVAIRLILHLLEELKVSLLLAMTLDLWHHLYLWHPTRIIAFNTFVFCILIKFVLQPWPFTRVIKRTHWLALGLTLHSPFMLFPATIIRSDMWIMERGIIHIVILILIDGQRHILSGFKHIFGPAILILNYVHRIKRGWVVHSVGLFRTLFIGLFKSHGIGPCLGWKQIGVGVLLIVEVQFVQLLVRRRLIQY